MPSSRVGIRKRVQALIDAAEGTDRYVDLCLVLRRLTADFESPVPEGYSFIAGDIEFITCTSGTVGVPIRSSKLGESVSVSAGSKIDGPTLGTLRAETILSAGGRWDTLRQLYTADPPAAPLVFDLMESQVEVARWYSAWLDRFKARQGSKKKIKDYRTLLNYGARGGGKTVLCLLLLVAAAIDVPDSICWVISVSRPQSQEDIHENLIRLLPTAWYAYRGQPIYALRFLNGSRIREMTADTPEDLKQGRVDVALLNEAAKTDRRAYAYPLGRVSDRGGIMLLASNPPTADVPKGVWVLDLHEKLKEAEKEKKWFPCVVFRTDAAANAAIDAAARDDVGTLLHAISPQIAAADAEGLMRPIGERIIYAFDKQKHGKQYAPHLGDITAEFTRRRFGRAYPYLAGVDFQDHPYIIASYFKIYGSIDKPILWCVSDFAIRGSEDDFLDEALLAGVLVGEGESDEIEQGTVLWIGDSSAQWQDRKNRGQQSTILPPSFSFWKHRGLTIIPPAEKITPEARYSKNPPISVSLGQVNRLLAMDRLFISPLAKHVGKALHECQARPTMYGVRPEKKYAHAIDTVRYVAWWVDPPVRRRAPGAGDVSTRLRLGRREVETF